MIVITLYGMLKSGVVKGTSNTSVYARTALFSYTNTEPTIGINIKKWERYAAKSI